MLRNFRFVRPIATIAAIAVSTVVMAQSDPAAPEAAAGVTAVSGLIVGLDGNGLADVQVSDNTQTTRTAIDGRFLLSPIPSNASVLRVDGRHVGAGHQTDYGFYEIRIDATPGRTTPIGYKIWLTPIDHTHDITIASPTVSGMVIQTPAIPGLELHIPAGVVVRDAEGKVVTKIGITALQIDHLPFPIPKHFTLPIFFTIQPGAACLYTSSGGVGAAQIFYPNFSHELPKARATFWRYEPDAHGWNPYGTGTVSADQSQVVPDPGVEISDFGSAECDISTRSVTVPAERFLPRPVKP